MFKSESGRRRREENLTNVLSVGFHCKNIKEDLAMYLKNDITTPSPLKILFFFFNQTLIVFESDFSFEMKVLIFN